MLLPIFILTLFLTPGSTLIHEYIPPDDEFTCYENGALLNHYYKQDGVRYPSDVCKSPEAHCIIFSNGTSGCVKDGTSCFGGQDKRWLKFDLDNSVACCKKGPSCDNKITKNNRNAVCRYFKPKPESLCEGRPEPDRCYKFDPETGKDEPLICTNYEASCGLGFPGGLGCIYGERNGPGQVYPSCLVHPPGHPKIVTNKQYGCFCKGNLCNAVYGSMMTDAIAKATNFITHSIECDPTWENDENNFVCLHYQEDRKCYNNSKIQTCSERYEQLFCKINRVTGKGEGCVSAKECPFWRPQSRDEETGKEIPRIVCEGDTCCCAANSRNETCFTEDFRTLHVCTYNKTEDPICKIPYCQKDDHFERCGTTDDPSGKWACSVNLTRATVDGCQNSTSCPEGCDGGKCCCSASTSRACNDLCRFRPGSFGCPVSGVRVYEGDPPITQSPVPPNAAIKYMENSSGHKKKFSWSIICMHVGILFVCRMLSILGSGF